MKLPVPQRGQPFDVSLISGIITSINELWDNLVINASNYASLATSQGRKNIRLTDVKIVTGTVDIESNRKAASETPFRYFFDMPFALPPVVTATAQTKTTTEAAKNAYAVITSVTESEVNGIVKFETKGEASITVNIIAIGQPQ
jgi:hypothetical protein